MKHADTLQPNYQIVGYIEKLKHSITLFNEENIQNIQKVTVLIIDSYHFTIVRNIKTVHALFKMNF